MRGWSRAKIGRRWMRMIYNSRDVIGVRVDVMIRAMIHLTSYLGADHVPYLR